VVKLNFIDYSVYAEALTRPTLNTMRVGFYGRAASQPNVTGSRIGYNVGLVGYGQNFFGSKGIGIVGQGDQTGGYFSGTEYGVIANSDGITPRSLAVTDGTYFRWGLFDVITPSGNTTKFLRDDGTWQVPPGGGGGSGTVTYVNGTGYVSGIYLTGTVTTSGDLTLGGSLSLTTGNLTATAPGSAYYLSGSGWASTSSVMSVAGTNSGSAIVSSNTLTFNCLISGYQFRGTGATVYLEPVSDRKLKENIELETLGLTFVNSLIPYTYNMKGQTRKVHGFIHDQVAPLITGENDSLNILNENGVGGIDYMSLIAPLVKSVQELTAKVETLEKQLKG